MTAVVKCVLYWNWYADNSAKRKCGRKKYEQKGRCPVMEENNGKKRERLSRREQSASNRKEKKERGTKPKKRWGLRILGGIGTLILVGALTASMFVWIFLKYVDTSLRGHVEVDLSEYTQEVSTELYYQDAETEEWVMYQTLFMDGENRIWVGLDEISDNTGSH